MRKFRCNKHINSTGIIVLAPTTGLGLSCALEKQKTKQNKTTTKKRKFFAFPRVEAMALVINNNGTGSVRSFQ